MPIIDGGQVISLSNLFSKIPVNQVGTIQQPRSPQPMQAQTPAGAGQVAPRPQPNPQTPTTQGTSQIPANFPPGSSRPQQQPQSAGQSIFGRSGGPMGSGLV